MRVLKSVITYISYYFCFLVPRKKNIWLYSSLNGRFIDNTKYFFLYANEYCKDVRHVWISNSSQTIEGLRSKGFEAYHLESKKAKALSLKAGAFIYSSYINTICNAAFSGGGFRFNLWHGVPLKKIEHDIHSGPTRFLYNPVGFNEKWKRFCNSPSIIRKNDAVLTTSKDLVKIFSSAFRLPEQKVFIGQYPRLMPFNWSEEQLSAHIKKIEGEEMLNAINRFKKFNEAIIYMPTWRDDNPNFITEAIPDFQLLNETCKANNILFILKVHINTIFNQDISAFSNLFLLNSSFDVYPVLPYTTSLITDYSSIFFDYDLLNKKIIFYPFDLENYKSKSRELYFDYASVTQGELVAYTFEQLIKKISNKSSHITKHSFSRFVNTGFDYNKEIDFVKKKVGLKTT